MTRKQISDKILSLIQENFSVHIRPEQAEVPLPSIRELGYDSLRVLELIDLLEATFAIEIDFVMDDIQFSFGTIERISQLVQRKLPASVPPLQTGQPVTTPI